MENELLRHLIVLVIKKCSKDKGMSPLSRESLSPPMTSTELPSSFGNVTPTTLVNFHISLLGTLNEARF